MKILDSLQISRKIERMAFEIIEANFELKKLFLLGINNNGYNFAEMLKPQLTKISDADIILSRLTLNPKNPVGDEIKVEMDKQVMNGENVIVIDDVANTGRTLFYAMKIFMDILPAKVETAVLVDRMHKSFPISINFVGMTFATTIQDNIVVNLQKGREAVYLEM